MIQSNIDVQSGYDLIADEYARRIFGELEHKPLDCQLLDRFAAGIGNTGVVCDLGCGPGQIARYLQSRGVQACGVDLSPAMTARARQLNPGIEFAQGDMRALPAGDQTWAGIAAFYAIVNLAPASLAMTLREMNRVLVSGGKLLLSFHIGEDTSNIEEDLWGSGASLEFYFYRTGTVADLLRSADFEIEEIVEREPYAPEVEYQSRRAYIFATKPVHAPPSE